MKKEIIICVITLTLWVLPQPSFAQLEIIDKIGEVLIPGITSGIKSVIESSSGKKVKKEEVEKLQENLLANVSDLIGVIEQDAANIKALNELFSTSGLLYDDIGVMEALTKRDFLNEVDSSRSQSLYFETALLFALNWKQLEAKKAKLVITASNDVSPDIWDDITKYVKVIDENLISLNTILNLSQEVDLEMPFPKLQIYIRKLSKSGEFIEEIKEAVRNINIQLEARLKSFSVSLEKTKQKIKELKSTTE